MWMWLSAHLESVCYRSCRAFCIVVRCRLNGKRQQVQQLGWALSTALIFIRNFALGGLLLYIFPMRCIIKLHAFDSKRYQRLGLTLR
jgi:hypothetical protein